MSIMREKRWVNLKEFFEKLSVAADKDGIMIMFDGELLEDYTFNIIDVDKCAQFDHTTGRSIFGLFLDSENETTTSAASIIKEIKSRVKLYKQIKF